VQLQREVDANCIEDFIPIEIDLFSGVNEILSNIFRVMLDSMEE
jgi:hypothetical protein